MVDPPRQIAHNTAPVAKSGPNQKGIMMTKYRHWILIAAVMMALTPAAFAQDDARDSEVIGGGDTMSADPAGDAGEAGDSPEGQPAEGDTAPAPKGGGGLFGGNNMFFIIIGVFLVVMIMMSSSSKKKQQRQRQEMLASLKKGDKVVSIGGIVGSVVEVREDEVTVKTDETNNIRMKFARWAIRGTGEMAKAEDPNQAASASSNNDTNDDEQK
jgi:preprotein translocase subunit YajC